MSLIINQPAHMLMGGSVVLLYVKGSKHSLHWHALGLVNMRRQSSK